MRVLAAPDKFRGTLTAAEAAAAIASGWRRAKPSDEVEELPMADGGEGTLEALVAALDGEEITARATGPLGDPVDASFGIAGDLSVVEMARASGLTLVPPKRRDPLRATTYGTGELILEACRRHPKRVIVCIGGSATTDGGAGMAQALGARLLDAKGDDLGPGGAALLELDRIDANGIASEVREAEFVVASDVDNPLLGSHGAAAVYGPQKGASPEDVELLDRALARYADVVRRDLDVDVAHLPGGGAAGGLGAGLVAFLGATMRSGVEVVMDATRFRERLQAADAVVTGEGKLDEQSVSGKTVSGVMRAAKEIDRPVAIVCGQVTVEPPGVPVVSLVQRFGRARAFEDTAGALQEAVADLAKDWPS